ncbi:MAG: DUF4159 domain-containing protein [Albidovulum sp.]|nr:DUF4159 domain-containing protein [Albidovulum sp.]MDE0305733.1 DUF4159 domain-containing protein [Albidovulum sp.]
MLSLGPVGFAEPLALVGLAALPLVWLLLRALPPPARRLIFPAAVLLKGLRDSDSTAKTTPIWLRIARLAAIGAMILAFAEPVLNPEKPLEGSQGRPLLILLDGNWADASEWPLRLKKAADILEAAERAARPTAVAMLTALPQTLVFKDPSEWEGSLETLEPNSWEADEVGAAQWALSVPSGEFDTYWIADGLFREGRTELASALAAKGKLTVLEGNGDILAIRPPSFHDGDIRLELVRLDGKSARLISVDAVGADPAGFERVLASTDVEFRNGDATAVATFSLMTEVRNRIKFFRIRGVNSAGAVALSADSLLRRKVALFGGRPESEGKELLSPLHYLRRALETNAEIIEGSLEEIFNTDPDVIVLSDTAKFTEIESGKLLAWVNSGGSLLRFAGPRLAANSADSEFEDELLPVKLRAGGRTIGGTMSWGESRKLKEFDEESPFFGLSIPDDLYVNAQVLAQPELDLADKVLASLEDGTPLVTRKRIGSGKIDLFHITANAEWSNLPISGLFVDMLDRLAVSAGGGSENEDEHVAKLDWIPERLLDGRGRLNSVGFAKPVSGLSLVEEEPRESAPPGIYRNGTRRIARNVFEQPKSLVRARWPSGIDILPIVQIDETRLKGHLIAVALALLAFDTIASLWLGGRLRKFALPASAAIATLALALTSHPSTAFSDDAKALRATAETVIAYFETGDEKIDAVSRAGLIGLSERLSERTAVEPASPEAVNPEVDELAFYPLIYWPIIESGNSLSSSAYANVNNYLRNGGMILFDTRDSHLGGFGLNLLRPEKMSQLAAQLDIPRLEPLPEGHVLSRSFYLLNDFPGRHAGGKVWVEAIVERDPAEGAFQSTVNDGVSPVIVGGNDWAAAWAIADDGGELFRIGRGSGGERQREAAIRFGINLVMYALSGNYKSDQVHVARLLRRQGS